MKTPQQDLSDIAIPALLRFALKTYGSAMREALSRVGCDDMPRNGMYVIGGMLRTGQPAERLARQVARSPEKVAALVQELEQLGYLAASNGSLTLTERGKHAAAASRAAVETIDAELMDEVGRESVDQMKSTLAVLIDIHDRKHGLPRGKR